MDLSDINPSFKQIAAAMAVVFLLITGLNTMLAPDGGYAGDLADTISNNDNSNNGDAQNQSQDQTDPYYEKATDDSTSSDSGNSDGSGSLNETEKTKIENNFEGYVNASNRDNGIYLDRKAVAGEWNNIQVMYNGNPVEGAEVLVNGQSIGATGEYGGVYFKVPQADRITVRTTTENLGTVENTYKVY
ncbi:hypothetical protein GKQ38_04860 [Candidatus Nanohaloarchaea archaeon]|nr:hypothetical protein GKQ38_04860 [Candidatus Nanohaloarchaea archaeon]